MGKVSLLYVLNNRNKEDSIIIIIIPFAGRQHRTDFFIAEPLPSNSKPVHLPVAHLAYLLDRESDKYIILGMKIKSLPVSMA